MTDDEPERKLAAILAADVVGFSRMMGADEGGTLARLAAARREAIDPLVSRHRGRIFKVMGDGFLVEFPSAVQALRCAIALQDRMAELGAGTPSGQRIMLRIGLHQGDVVVVGDDLLGEGVNIAARLEPLADPGGICISARVREDAGGRIALAAEDMGERALKNIGQPLRLYRVCPGAGREPTGDTTLLVLPAAASHRLMLETGRELPVTGRLTFGRLPPSDELLTGSEVSRAHCQVELVEDAVVVTDLRSTNGTYVDDERIAAPTRLRPGSLLRIGPHLLRYQRDAPPEVVDEDATQVLLPAPRRGARAGPGG